LLSKYRSPADREQDIVCLAAFTNERSMKLTLLSAALIGVCAIPFAALAQNCRANFGGNYTAPHSGIKPDGNFFTTTGFFAFNPVGTFDVSATIVEPGVRTFAATASSKWWWIGPCDIAIDRAAFVGHVSNDARFVSLETFDAEQLTGTGVRDSVAPDRSVAQANGSEGAFSETSFGRLFAETLANQFTSRTAALRGGASGFAVTPVRLAQLSTASDQSRTTPPDDRFGGFASGQLLFGDRTFLPLESARSFTVGGPTLGLDYRIGSASAIGLAGSYFTGDLNIAGGTTSARSGALSVYGVREAGPLYLDGFAGGGLTGYRTSRSFNFGGVPFAASGAPSGHIVAVGGNAGYRFEQPRARLRWGPVGELRFNRVSIDAYSETGGLGAYIRGRDSSSVQTGLGAEFALDLPTALGILTPHLRATWRHEFGDATDTAIANFLVSSEAPVTVTSAPLGRDFCAITAGIGGRLARDIFLSADYAGQLGRRNQTVHQVSLTARITF